MKPVVYRDLAYGGFPPVIVVIMIIVILFVVCFPKRHKYPPRAGDLQTLTISTNDTFTIRVTSSISAGIITNLGKLHVELVDIATYISSRSNLTKVHCRVSYDPLYIAVQ